MSSISALNNSGYYQLSDPSAGTGGNIAQSNSTSALLQSLLSSSSSGTAASSSEAYLLDLSPQAQQYLNGIGAGSASGSAVSPLNSSSESFTLTTQQQQAITNILAKYKDAPYTQATFDDIQNDLQAAGLDPTTLSRQDQAQSFNATQLFIDDLNGNTSAADNLITPDESSKSSNYMQQIISQWKTISGNTGEPSASTSSSGTAASTSGA